MKLSPALLAACLVLAPLAYSQTQSTGEACMPSTTLDELITALDAAVSGPADKDRACMRELVLPDARLTPMTKTPGDSLAPHILTLDGWIEAVKKHGKDELNEHQIKVKQEVYGSIAHLWSTYELHLSSDPGKAIRGINSIQAVYDGKRWRVYGILWQAETPATPIPEKYLP
ncbi:MAG TPA: hypothetical protein VG844_12605 [Terracidiphilus sp.]|nr:hypothetical protein [Terracidiphilus sp.]